MDVFIHSPVGGNVFFYFVSSCVSGPFCLEGKCAAVLAVYEKPFGAKCIASGCNVGRNNPCKEIYDRQLGLFTGGDGAAPCAPCSAVDREIHFGDQCIKR